MKFKSIYSSLLSNKNAYLFEQNRVDLVQIKQYINTPYNEKLNQNSELTLFSIIC